MAHLTREQILARKTGKGTATLPDGTTVAIRGLTHAEVIESQQIDDLNERTCWIVAKAMTDPVMSVDDVMAWAAEGDAGDVVTVSEEVSVLSRLSEGAGKRGVPRSRKR
jgi:hypothetical protein